MTDSLQKIINDLCYSIQSASEQERFGPLADRLEALQKQPVAFRHHNREDVVPASWTEVDPVFGAYTIPLIRGD